MSTDLRETIEELRPIVDGIRLGSIFRVYSAALEIARRRRRLENHAAAEGIDL